MLPFLLVQTRSDDAVAADEVRSTTALGGFAPGELVPLRLDRAVAAAGPSSGGTADLDWEDLVSRHSGVIVGGSPFTSSDPEEFKSDLQVVVEAELRRLLDVVMDRDVPFLGACYGVGTLGLHQGASVDATYGEPAGAVRLRLTEAGRADPLLAGVAAEFEAFVGHKEAVRELPGHAVLLVAGEACPVQMFRIGRHQYATQFHPELDVEGLLYRLEVYADNGYYDPAEAEALFARVRAAAVDEPRKVLANFRRRYAREG
ncbi:glutamine amidotransferase [Citricoccus sp. SGAir0253]|uniref:glutamine amidotransferase n=1 Tax=Citricoccus sp. SGAir0253 TaxID=2567881 RepID=UPI0010CD46BD|nr:glutamine amidotransferase [Citricoccus sp. SGAir0253]QCU78866.1 glutamine amidotransferase [Citricoccus sp. SGAir0253]